VLAKAWLLPVAAANPGFQLSMSKAQFGEAQLGDFVSGFLKKEMLLHCK